MRYFIAMIGGLTAGLLASPAFGQVATMGGMANPSVAAGNMNAGANVAGMAGNANFLGGVRSGMGGGYGGTVAASAVGSDLAGRGGYPISAGDARYFSQNSGTVAGMVGTGAAIANQPGQPFALNRHRSMFTGGGVINYNPSVQARFGGRFNGRGYSGQSYGQGNSRGYNAPNYGGSGAVLNGRGMSGFGNGSSSGYWPPQSNNFQAYIAGQHLPGVGPGYAPYTSGGNAPLSYPTINALTPPARY
jgi:hypothetical protein